MATPTKEEVLAVLQNVDSVVDRIAQVARTVSQIRGSSLSGWDFCYDTFEEWGPSTINDDTVFTARMSKWYCGETDHSYIDFPVSYLWDEQFAEKEATAWAEKKRQLAEEEKARKEAEEAQAKIDREIYERNLLRRLREKYGE